MKPAIGERSSPSLICNIPFFKRKPKVEDHQSYGIWWGDSCDKWVIGNSSDKGGCNGYFQLSPETDEEANCIKDPNSYERINEAHLCVLKPTADAATSISNKIFINYYHNFGDITM